ncbi:MAG: toprim domain-containing protein [Polyangiaceae bacterium]
MHGPCDCGVAHGEDTRKNDNIEAVYPYHYENGSLCIEVVRLFGKRFFQRAPDGAGGYLRNSSGKLTLEGVRLVPFRLPELIAADPSKTVYVCEGEKDVLSLVRLGHVATCNPMGAGKWHRIADETRKVLAGRDVVVIADADKPGRDHARKVETSLHDVVRSIVVRECPAHKDVTDMLLAGGSLDDLIPLKCEADAPKAPNPANDTAPDAATGRLARNKQHRVLDDLDEGLADANTGDRRLYQRSGELVIARGATVDDAKRLHLKFSPEAVILSPLKSASLVPRITEHVDYGYWRYEEDADGSKTKTWVRDLPNGTVLAAFLSKVYWSHIRPIRGIACTPIIHLDGSIVAEGYDAETQYLVASNVALPPIPDHPTKDDAIAALAALVEPFAEFPFETDAERYSPVALGLTIILRPVIEGNVIAYIQAAPQPKCGKSLTAKTACLWATGQIPASNTWPKVEEEQEKMIGAAADAGADVLLFDNASEGAVIGGAPLDKVLTCDGVNSFRVLGQSTLKRLPWMATVAFTANKARIGADTERRAATSQLIRPDVPREIYAHEDLLSYVRQERPRLLAAAFTLVRAWIQAGKPRESVRRLDSFEHWGWTVASMIRWAGGGDVRELVHDVAETDNDGSEYLLLAGLHEWLTVRSERSTTAKALVEDVCAPGHREQFGELREAIEGIALEGKGERQTLNVKRFGNRLKAMANLRQGNYRLKQVGKDRNHHALWTVERIGAPTQSAQSAQSAQSIPTPNLKTESLSILERNDTADTADCATPSFADDIAELGVAPIVGQK